jgi:hypothetical protein
MVVVCVACAVTGHALLGSIAGYYRELGRELDETPGGPMAAEVSC